MPLQQPLSAGHWPSANGAHGGGGGMSGSGGGVGRGFGEGGGGEAGFNPGPHGGAGGCGSSGGDEHTTAAPQLAL